MSNKSILNKISKYNFFVAAMLLMLLAIAVLPMHVKAQSVTIDGTVDVYLSNQGWTFKLRGGTASSLTVTESSFTISTGSSDSIAVSSFEGKSLENDGGLMYECFGAETRVTVPSSKTVVFTPLGNIVCTGASGGSGSSGGGGGGGGGGSGGAVGSLSGSAKTEGGGSPSSVKFSDVSSKGQDGAGSIPSSVRKDIYEVIRLMEKANTFIPSVNDKFNPNDKTTRFFAIQVALALASRGCGSGITFNLCRDSALEAKIINAKNLPDRFITRVQFYEILIKAAGLRMIKNAGTIARYIAPCKDVSEEDDTAQIIATARYYKIAPVYKGNVCNATLPFPRSAAMTFTARAKDAMKR